MGHDHLIDFPPAEEGPPLRPLQPLADEGLGDAGVLQDLHGPAGEHDGAAAVGHLLLGLDDHALHPVAGQIDRREQPHRSGTDDDDRRGAGGLVHLRGRRKG